MKYLLPIFLVLLVAITGQAQSQKYPLVKTTKAAYFDKSKPLREVAPHIPGIRDRSWKEGIVENKFIPPMEQRSPATGDPVVQKKAGTLMTRGPIQNFDGVGNVNGVLPPDTDGDVGPDHYFQMINLSFSIYDKEGNQLYGPANNSTLWDGFVGSWTGTNDGDPILLYDEEADRWIASQFAVNTSDNTFWELVAISETSDPLGAYYRYAFQYDLFNDYPKIGIWPNAYVVTFNMFSNNGFEEIAVAAYDREAMLTGDPEASQQVFSLGNGYFAALPADFDGPLPPEGAPNYLVHMKRYGSVSIQLFEVNIDWEFPENSSVDLTQTIPVSAFSTSSIGVPQPNTPNRLDDFSGQAMHRLQYRNFGDYEVLMLNHAVYVSSQGTYGLRWYELRKDTNDWELYQEGTFAPNDSLNRWMGSIAMNGNGDIALGYSVSSSEKYPSIRYVARTADAPLGVMNTEEVEVVQGVSSQANYSRWGDYATMSVDPVNDSTFWFTTEYMKYGWKTRIASFNLDEILAPVINAGPDTAICNNNYFNTGHATSQNAASYEWTSSGDGVFVPSNTELDVNYIRGNEDMINGGASIYVEVTGYDPELTAIDSLYLTIVNKQVIEMINDTIICDDQNYETDALVENASSVYWSTSGDGNFEDATSVLTTYYPGQQDIQNGSVDLTLTAYPLEPCEDEESEVIELGFTICSSLEGTEQIISDVWVSPNPSNGFFNIVLSEAFDANTVVTITSVNGQVVYQKELKKLQSDLQVDLKDAPRGIYFIQVEDKETTLSRKIILQ